MVSRTVYPTVPPQVEYALTTLGHSLALPLQSLGSWAGEHLDEIEENRLRYDVGRDGDLEQRAAHAVGTRSSRSLLAP